MIVVVGGWYRKSTVETFDPLTQSWHSQGDGCTPAVEAIFHYPNLTEGRSYCAAVSLGQCVYVLGGEKSNGTTNEVAILNTATRSWTMGPCMQTKRRFLGAAVLEGKIYAAGGSDGSKRMDFIPL